MNNHLINIEGRKVGNDQPVFIIAEAGVNHNGNLELAKKLIDAAVDAGADSIKFQTFIAEELVSKDAPKAKYQMQTTDAFESQLDMIKKLELSREDHIKLIRYAKNKILLMSTPFDNKSVDLLIELGVPAIKISSGEITNHPFLSYIAEKGLPVILSTGMSTLEEVREAVSVIRDAGCVDLILLHCTSNYPAHAEDCNLKAMRTMADEFKVPVGYSDHTTGILVPIAAVAMGACVIEKHFTLDKNLPGPDHKASLDPNEFKEMVYGIRMVEKALGSNIKAPMESEFNIRDIARKSIVAKMDIPAGTMITKDLLAFKRPGTGIAPKYANMVIGKITKQNINKDEMIKIDTL